MSMIYQVECQKSLVGNLDLCFIPDLTENEHTP